MAAAHREGIIEDLGGRCSDLQARSSDDCVLLALSRVRLVGYVRDLRAFGAASQKPRAFDDQVVEELMLRTPPVVQEAILDVAHHAGRGSVEYPVSLRVLCSARFWPGIPRRGCKPIFDA